MFLSADTLTLDLIQFIKNSRLFFKRFQYGFLLCLLIPFSVMVDLPALVNLTHGLVTTILLKYIAFRDSLGGFKQDFLCYDGPYLWYWALGLIFLEARLLNESEPEDVQITGSDFQTRRILLRDRMFALIGFYLFSQQFFGNYAQFFSSYRIEDIAIFAQCRMWVATHWLLYSRLVQENPQQSMVGIIFIYRQIIRRRNGFDTIWIDFLKRYEWHNPGGIPPLKHFVRYNWCMAWFLEVFTSGLTQLVSLTSILAPPEVAMQFQQFIITLLYHGGTCFFVIGIFCSILGLRAWCPFLHVPVSCQVGYFNPPGRTQPASNEQADFDPYDEDNPYMKFRF